MSVEEMDGDGLDKSGMGDETMLVTMTLGFCFVSIMLTERVLGTRCSERASCAVRSDMLRKLGCDHVSLFFRLHSRRRRGASNERQEEKKRRREGKKR